VEYSYGQSVNYEYFFVLACYVDEATLRHVHLQGGNTTKDDDLQLFYIAIHNR